MLIKEYVEFPAYTGVEDRKIFIYLPNDYQVSEKCYPVLYMFDGQNVFLDHEATYGRSWRMADYLNENRVDLIVVSVECHRGSDGERNDEYGPFPMYLEGRWHECYADDTLEWFINELKPMIDGRFRTIPFREATFIGGSSMGGLIATYALLKYNEIFSKAASLSPAYYLCKKDFKNFIKNVELDESVLYTDYGTLDLEMPRGMRDFLEINKLLGLKGVNVTSRMIPGGEHNEANWDKQLPFMIQVLMYE